MKIRTDFVTNSSSSSFVTVHFVMKSGETVKYESAMDDIGHGDDPMSLAFMSETEVKEILESENDADGLLYKLNDHYQGMLLPVDFDLDFSLITFDNIDNIIICDLWSDEYGKKYRVFYYDPSVKQCRYEDLQAEDGLPEDIDDNLAGEIRAAYEIGDMEPDQIADMFGLDVEDVMLVLDAEDYCNNIISCSSRMK